MTDDARVGAPRALASSEKEGALSDWRPKFASGVLICVLVLGLLVLAPNIYFSLGPWATLFFVVLWAFFGGAAVWRGSYRLRVVTSLVILAAAGSAAILSASSPGNGTFFFLAFVTVAAMLWSPRAGAVAAAIAILIFAAIAALAGAGLLGVSGNVPAMRALAGWIGASLAVVLFGVAIVVGLGHMQGRSVGMTATASIRDESPASSQTAPQADAAGSESLTRKALEVVRGASPIRDPSQLATRVVDLVATVFGYPFVALFLLNEQGNQLVPRSAAGASGGSPDERGRELPLEGSSLAAIAARSREIRQRHEIPGAESATGNPPPQGAEVALPLVVEDRLLGALELHSAATHAFGAEALDALMGLADYVALALETATALESSRQGQEDRAVLEPRDGGRYWEPDLGAGALHYEVGEHGLPGSSLQMDIPLSLRDEAIGSISLTSESDWSADERSLVEAVATQAALALENAQLVEVSQLSARREHMLAEITSKVWASTSIEGVLRTALQELAQVLSADQATIELRAEQPDDQ